MQNKCTVLVPPPQPLYPDYKRIFQYNLLDRFFNITSNQINTINGVKLTSKKMIILNLLASDLCDKQIANQLNISIGTLDTHKQQLFKIFKVHSKTGLISEAFHKLILVA
jgi:DNA-binding NarL/FixJ family response regulator